MKYPASRRGSIASGEDGFILVTSLAIMAMMSVMASAIIVTSSTDMKIAANATRSTQAFFAAETGINGAAEYLRGDVNWGPSNWGSNNQGSFQLGGSLSASYSISLYDKDGTNGRTANSSYPGGSYVTLVGKDLLVETTGTVSGVSRKLGQVLRLSPESLQYASFSDNKLTTQGGQGSFSGKIYATDQINIAGNYDTSQARASSSGSINPNCNSGNFMSCDASATSTTPPSVDSSYYQDQGNFSTQQVFILTPSVGSPTSCGGSNCYDWQITYDITTQGSTNTAVASVNAVKSGGNWDHTVSWCQDISWGGSGQCPDDSSPRQYLFTSGNRVSKPLFDAAQFNAYTSVSGGYSSSVANIVTGGSDLDFLGPSSGTVDITASILVAQSTGSLKPDGKINFMGGAGTLNLRPSNGIAIAAKEIKIKSDFGPININVGTSSSAAVIVASKKLEVEKESGNAINFTMYGAASVGDGSGNGELKVDGANASFTYLSRSDFPQGWLAYGTVHIERREWREL